MDMEALIGIEIDMKERERMRMRVRVVAREAVTTKTR
jgi:hypothetical protein